MHAFEAAKPPSTRIPGLQEFAAAVSYCMVQVVSFMQPTSCCLTDLNMHLSTLSMNIMAAGSLAVLSLQDPVTQFPCNSNTEG
jgi:hypothetical protein